MIWIRFSTFWIRFKTPLYILQVVVLQPGVLRAVVSKLGIFLAEVLRRDLKSVLAGIFAPLTGDEERTPTPTNLIG